MACVRDIIAVMEQLAPPWLALDGDPTGLHAGDVDSQVKRIAFALDASLDAVAMAEKWRADMLIVHHPRFFRGISSLAASDATGRRAVAICRSGMAVYSAHTNFDLAENGITDQLAALVGLIQPEIVRVERTEKLYKLAVFVPTSHIDAVRQAITDAGTGAIGKYSACTFRTQGIGTFQGGDTTNPFIGKPGVLEQTDEFRLETVFGESIANTVLAAMHAAHPYEEVAYDLYQLVGAAKQFGPGRVGALAKTETLGTLAARMAKATSSPMAQYHGKAGRKISRAAVWAGAGVHAEDFARCGADVLIAGEVSYHELENFNDMGMAVITLGHNHSEEHAMGWLAEQVGRKNNGCAVRFFRKTGPSMNNV